METEPTIEDLIEEESEHISLHKIRLYNEGKIKFEELNESEQQVGFPCYMCGYEDATNKCIAEVSDRIDMEFGKKNEQDDLESIED